MILHYVTDRAYFFIEFPTTFYAKAFGHCDLHTLNVVAIPDRFQERIGEAKVEQILYRLLPKIVVDAEDRRLRKDGVQNLIQFPG